MSLKNFIQDERAQSLHQKWIPSKIAINLILNKLYKKELFVTCTLKRQYISIVHIHCGCQWFKQCSEQLGPLCILFLPPLGKFLGGDACVGAFKILYRNRCSESQPRWQALPGQFVALKNRISPSFLIPLTAVHFHPINGCILLLKCLPWASFLSSLYYCKSSTIPLMIVGSFCIYAWVNQIRFCNFCLHF